MYDATLLRVPLTFVTTEKQQRVRVSYWITWHCQRYKNLKRCI